MSDQEQAESEVDIALLSEAICTADRVYVSALLSLESVRCPDAAHALCRLSEDDVAGDVWETSITNLSGMLPALCMSGWRDGTRDLIADVRAAVEWMSNRITPHECVYISNDSAESLATALCELPDVQLPPFVNVLATKDPYEPEANAAYAASTVALICAGVVRAVDVNRNFMAVASWLLDSCRSVNIAYMLTHITLLLEDKYGEYWDNNGSSEDAMRFAAFMLQHLRALCLKHGCYTLDNYLAIGTELVETFTMGDNDPFR